MRGGISSRLWYIASAEASYDSIFKEIKTFGDYTGRNTRRYTTSAKVVYSAIFKEVEAFGDYRGRKYEAVYDRLG